MNPIVFNQLVVNQRRFMALIRVLINTLIGLLLISQVTSASKLPEHSLTIQIDGQSSANINQFPQLLINSDRPSAVELSAGRRLFTRIKQQKQLIDDLIIQQYLSSLGQLLVDHAMITHSNHVFFMIQDNSVNAFAGPAQYIGIHSGLVQMVDSEDQLASVIAHEIAHQKLDHLQRISDNLKQTPLVNPLLLIGIILAGIASDNVEAATAGFLFAAGGAMDQQLSYSRAFELEADSLGIHILSASGFNATAALEMMHKLEQQELDSQVYLSTHPNSSDRINRLQNQLTQIHDDRLNRQYINENLHSQLNFHLIQARLMWLQEPTIQVDQLNDLSVIQKNYLRLLQALEAQHWQQFEELWQQFSHHSLLFDLVRAEAYVKQQQWQQLHSLLQSMKLHAANHLAVIALEVQYLVHKKHFTKALKLLQRQRLIHPHLHQAYLWAMTADIHRLNNDAALSLAAKAHERFYQGHVRHSLSLLNEAIELADDRTTLVARLKNTYRQYHAALYSSVNNPPPSQHCCP